MRTTIPAARLQRSQVAALSEERLYMLDSWRESPLCSERELSQLVIAITVINAWNRVNITTRLEPGHYQPGQFDGRAAPATPDRS